MLQNNKRLGDVLIEAGLLTQAQLERAQFTQQKNGDHLSRTLIKLGYITEENILKVLEEQYGVSHVDLNAIHISQEAVATISESLAKRYQVIPISKESQKLTLAMADPTNFFAIDDVRMATGCEVKPVIAAEHVIMHAISQYYSVNDLVKKAVQRFKQDEQTAVSQVHTEDDAPIIGIVSSLFTQALREHASDIHIEPQASLLRVRFRVDGLLREVVSFTRNIHAAIVSRIKIMANMDITEKRLPQDGRIDTLEQGREVNIRVSTLPTIDGEKVVMRILDKKAVILDINKLGFTTSNLECYRQLYSQSHGMILATGPTGSGKTTTLYSTLAQINTIDRNTITIEDPVEYRLAGTNQVQVNPKAGLTFANGLRSILRQDPNVIMVGEIRDGETADIAIRAALTGHLVLSTLHTNDAAGAITRLIDMGVEPFLVASSVLGVLAQRLVRVICPECKKRYIPAYGSGEQLFLNQDKSVSLYKGLGCANCAFTGYRGRMAIQEVMPVSSQIRKLINRRASTDEIAAVASNEGMLAMREDGIQKALAGFTTMNEVMRVTYVYSKSEREG